MRFLLLLLALLIAGPSHADVFSCTVPRDFVARMGELCESLRVSVQVRPGGWSDDICVSELIRRSLLARERTAVRAASRRTVNDDVTTAVDDFNRDFPQDITRATCGDGTLDTEFGEQCDDGNTVDNDGCSESCQSE